MIKHDIDYVLLEKGQSIYSVSIFNVQLRDSLNFMNMSLKEVGENYCTLYHKTSIDYAVPYDHQPSEEEIEYCLNDCLVLKEGLTNYFASLIEVLGEAGCYRTIDKLPKKLTNAGIAFEAFKELSQYDKCCPKTSFGDYENMRPAYKGGYVYSRPSGIQENIKMIDCNSMYPFVYGTKRLPIGRAYRVQTLEELLDKEFYIVWGLIKYDLKVGKLPTIGGTASIYGGIEYRKTSNGLYEEIVVCSYDFRLIQKFYDYDLKFTGGVYFDTAPNFFKKFADTFMTVKNKSKGAKRQAAKIMLNSPYGKTAMNGLNKIKDYFIDEDDIIKSNVVGYELKEDAYQYLPIAISITAQARYHLLSTAEAIGFDHVYYMDTDSIKFDSSVQLPFECNDNVLGDWKDEGIATLFKTIAPKKYVVYDKNNTIKYTCAGFSKKELAEQMQHGEIVTRERAIELMHMFDAGLSLDCLQSTKTVGGRALIAIRKEIK